jgi:hypothetical protein
MEKNCFNCGTGHPRGAPFLAASSREVGYPNACTIVLETLCERNDPNPIHSMRSRSQTGLPKIFSFRASPSPRPPNLVFRKRIFTAPISPFTVPFGMFFHAKNILFSPGSATLAPESRAPCGFHPNIAKSRNFGFCGKLCDFLRFFSGTPRGRKTRDIVLTA